MSHFTAGLSSERIDPVGPGYDEREGEAAEPARGLAAGPDVHLRAQPEGVVVEPPVRRRVVRLEDDLLDRRHGDDGRCVEPCAPLGT